MTETLIALAFCFYSGCLCGHRYGRGRRKTLARQMWKQIDLLRNHRRDN